MRQPNPTFRPATSDDAIVLAELVNYAGEGMPLYLWGLENLVPGTWYINVLAVQPQFRRQGLGARLLALAEERAEVSRKRGISVIVSDANTGARQLYERCGYKESATRLMVKENWKNEGQSW